MKKKIQKPFDAEAAKRGARVETRSGRSVRIICYNKKGSYPIVALVTYGDDENDLIYSVEGKYIRDRCSNDDLVIVEEIECPKFQVGAFIVFNGNVYEILYVDNTNNLYHFQSVKYGFSQKRPTKNMDNVCKHWDINDARPGDVLICKDDNRPFIYSGYSYNGDPSAFCGIDVTASILIGTSGNAWTHAPIRPATYKERRQFFDRLKEEGYKWDSESFTLSKIQKRWRDNEYKTISGYYTHSDSRITYSKDHNNTKENYNIFATEKQAKSALAMARISQIMANDERFGGVITDEEWNTYKNYIIIRIGNNLGIETRYCYEYLAFHTKEQAELFLEENEDLIKDYYMLD